VRDPGHLGDPRRGCPRPRRADGDDINGVASGRHRPVRHRSDRHRPAGDRRADHHAAGHHAKPHDFFGKHSVDHPYPGPDAAGQDAIAGIAFRDVTEHYAIRVVLIVRRIGGPDLTIVGSVGVGGLAVGGVVLSRPGPVYGWPCRSLASVGRWVGWSGSRRFERTLPAAKRANRRDCSGRHIA